MQDQARRIHYSGVANRKAFLDFQERHDLAQNGDVDEHAAKFIYDVAPNNN